MAIADKIDRTLVMEKSLLEQLIRVHMLAIPWDFNREIEEISIDKDKIKIVYGTKKL